MKKKVENLLFFKGLKLKPEPKRTELVTTSIIRTKIQNPQSSNYKPKP